MNNIQNNNKKKRKWFKNDNAITPPRYYGQLDENRSVYDNENATATDERKKNHKIFILRKISHFI